MEEPRAGLALFHRERTAPRRRWWRGWPSAGGAAPTAARGRRGGRHPLPAPCGPTGAALAGLERGWLCTGGAGLRSPRCWPLLRRAGATSFRAPPRTGGALLLAGATCRSRCAKSPPPVTGRAAAGRTTTRLSPGSTASVSHPDAQASERSHTPHPPPHPTPLPNKNPNAHARRSNAAAQRWAPSAWGRSGRGRTQRRAVSSSAWRSCG